MFYEHKNLPEKILFTKDLLAHQQKHELYYYPSHYNMVKKENGPIHSA